MKKNSKSKVDNPANENMPSKSALKRQSAALQKLGEELLAFAPDIRKKLDLPEELEAAFALCAQIKEREAARRQRQYIGRLMRKINPDDLRENLDRNMADGELATEASRKAFGELKRIISEIDNIYHTY